MLLWYLYNLVLLSCLWTIHFYKTHTPLIFCSALRAFLFHFHCNPRACHFLADQKHGFMVNRSVWWDQQRIALGDSRVSDAMKCSFICFGYGTHALSAQYEDFQTHKNSMKLSKKLKKRSAVEGAAIASILLVSSWKSRAAKYYTSALGQAEMFPRLPKTHSTAWLMCQQRSQE